MKKYEWWNSRQKDRRFEDRKNRMGLDEYGFPVTLIANSILLEQDGYGDSSREIEDAWLEWNHYNPFDAPVAARLTSLFRERRSRLDREKDGEQLKVLDRKLQLVSGRAERYDLEHFVR